MISLASLFNFSRINATLLMFSTIQYSIHVSPINQFVKYTAWMASSFALLELVEWVSRNKPQIVKMTPSFSSPPSPPSHPHPSPWAMIKNISLEYIFFQYLVRQLIPSTSYLMDFATFIPVSFLFEIVFDFFHYCSHRMVHEIPVLYAYSHKTHHTHLFVTVYDTYLEDLSELVLTNCIPVYLTLCCFPSMSVHMFFIIFTYKKYGEICGHCGKQCYPVGCFPQCIWIPRMLGIELYSENHSDHHYHGNCNYSKRFSLFDKLFGTYRAIKYKMSTH